MAQPKHKKDSDIEAQLDDDARTRSPGADGREVTEEHDAADRHPSKETSSAPLSTSLVPVTTLQQYLTEIRRYPISARKKSYASSRNISGTEAVMLQ